MGKFRTERDTLGEIQVPAEKLWGAQTNMNMNEVLANRASELFGCKRGEKWLVHPNDDVNKGQSSNDIFPIAMHLVAVQAITQLLIPAVHKLRYMRRFMRKSRAAELVLTH